jgi:hypothetical protein
MRVLEEPAAAEPSAGPAGEPSGEPRPASPIGAVTVPPGQEGPEASVLPRSYQDLLEVAADAGARCGRRSSRPRRGWARTGRRWRARRRGALAAELAGLAAAGLTAFELEELLDERGRKPGAGNFCPADAALSLPAGTPIPSRSWPRSRPPGALRASTAKAAARLGKMRTRLTAGEKPNRKRMAALVTVYDAEPARRRPHDVIAPPGGRHGTRHLRPGPKALGKWLAGSVRHGPGEVIAAASDEAGARDPAHPRTWVVLVDGAEHQLDLIRAEAARRGVTIHIVIDIIHVLELSAGPDLLASTSSTMVMFTLCHRC